MPQGFGGESLWELPLPACKCSRGSVIPPKPTPRRNHSTRPQPEPRRPLLSHPTFPPGQSKLEEGHPRGRGRQGLAGGGFSLHVSRGRASCCHPQPRPVVPDTCPSSARLLPLHPLAPQRELRMQRAQCSLSALPAPGLMWTLLVPSHHSQHTLLLGSSNCPLLLRPPLPSHLLSATRSVHCLGRPGTPSPLDHLPMACAQQGLVPEASGGGARHSQPNFPNGAQALGRPLPEQGDGQCLPKSSGCLWAFPKQRPPNSLQPGGQGPLGSLREAPIAPLWLGMTATSGGHPDMTGVKDSPTATSEGATAISTHRSPKPWERMARGQQV